MIRLKVERCAASYHPENRRHRLLTRSKDNAGHCVPLHDQHTPTLALGSPHFIRPCHSLTRSEISDIEYL
jgi:hypothetical protein